MNNQKLTQLRAAMASAGIDAYIIPNTDSHQSEYFSKYYCSITWLCGFTGSNATVLVTENFGGLWTDGRYFLQASQELVGSGVELQKMKDQTKPEYIDWAALNLPNGAKVGIDGRLFSIAQYKEMERLFAAKGIQVVANLDLVDRLWEDRPAVMANEIFEHDIQYAGKSRADKIALVRKNMARLGVQNYLITALDDIGWFFNIRGSDVDYNPVTYAFAVVNTNTVHLFIQSSKVPAAVKASLEADGVELQEYDAIEAHLASLTDTSILLAASQTNYLLYSALPESCVVKMDISIVQCLKGRKNATEQSWLRNVMVKDGVAVSRFIKWIEDNIGKIKITELSASNRLHEFRAEQDLFFGDSFPAISSYRGNGAIIHYKVTEESDTELHPNGIYLIDSGGQYIDGTTDITRTLTLGEPTEEEKKCYTLVLKGHIGVAALTFPEGTRGNQIDVMARQPFWQYGLNFRHGTGHGVGFFMNVHEGPQRIGPGADGAFSIAIIAGMYTSNEPGFYKEGEFGMRIENLMLTQKAEETEYGQFLHFETITLAPLENKLVDVSLLTEAERKWYNDYHAEVLDKLGSQMTEEERAWLAEKCAAI
jgi:Xaa-Pro aminopeptidase